MKRFLNEFKKFAMRGSVIDMAVGVIVGGAFKAIADSLVNDIINPILGIFAGGHSDLAALSFSLPGGGELMLGSFLNAILNFIIMAFVVFCIVTSINKAREIGAKKEEEAPAAPPAPSAEEKLLSEIRDLLKSKE